MTTSFKIAIRAGLITSLMIVVFWVISQLTLYRYLKTEYYVAAVAITFLAVGILISRSNAITTRTLKNSDPIQELTQKELLILAQIADGKSNKEIAAGNFVELSTVKTHINNIYSKLGVRSRKKAVKAYAAVRK